MIPFVYRPGRVLEEKVWGIEALNPTQPSEYTVLLQGIMNYSSYTCGYLFIKRAIGNSVLPGSILLCSDE